MFAIPPVRRRALLGSRWSRWLVKKRGAKRSILRFEFGFGFSASRPPETKFLQARRAPVRCAILAGL